MSDVCRVHQESANSGHNRTRFFLVFEHELTAHVLSGHGPQSYEHKSAGKWRRQNTVGREGDRQSCCVDWPGNPSGGCLTPAHKNRTPRSLPKSFGLQTSTCAASGEPAAGVADRKKQSDSHSRPPRCLGVIPEQADMVRTTDPTLLRS